MLSVGAPSNNPPWQILVASYQPVRLVVTCSHIGGPTLLPIDANNRKPLQDWPGRVKLWNVGVPPSGPMDMYAFRFANALVGNTSSAAGLEFAIQGSLQHKVLVVLNGFARRCAHAHEYSACNLLILQHVCAAGPTVKFHVAAVVALTGAEFDAKLDDKPVPCWTSFAVAAGTTLAIGMVTTTCLPAS